jgi:hypothetical protein
MKCRSIRLAHDPIASNTLLRVPRDTRERVSVQNDKENANMKTIKVTFVVSALALLALLGGCVAIPVGPGPYAGSPGYYAPPVYYGPSIGIGIYGGRHGHGFR